MRTRYLLASMAVLALIAACAGEDKPGKDNVDAIEESLDPSLAADTIVLQRLRPSKDGQGLSKGTATSFLVDGFGSVVVGPACFAVRTDGTVKGFTCPDQEILRALPYGEAVLLVGKSGNGFVVGGAGQDQRISIAASDFWTGVAGGQFGRSLQANTVLQAAPKSEYPKPDGITVRRLVFDASGTGIGETVLDVSNVHSIGYQPLWVEELAPGKIGLLYVRSEVVYLEDGQETILSDGLSALGSGSYTFSQIHRTGSTLWFGSQPEGGTPLLVRWDPKSGEKPKVISSPEPSPEWIGLHGFLDARTQVTTPNPLAASLDVPEAYTVRGFDGSGLEVAPVALTPCTTRAACRRIGESYLLGVVGMETAAPKALYGLWAWQAPPGGVQNGPTDYVGYYLSPLRAPEEPMGDAGVPESSVDGSPDAAQQEASAEGGDEPEAGPGGPETLASGLNVPRLMRLQGEYVFFTESTDQQNVARINRLPKAGGTVETWVADAGWPMNLISDDQALYYPTQHFGSAGVIESVPLTGGPAVQLVNESAQALAVRDGYLYWTPDMAALRRMNLATKVIEQLGQAGGWSIAVDATYVYSGTADAGPGPELLMRVALPSGPVEQLASVTDARFLLVDDTTIFTRGYGLIGAVPKQGGQFTKLADLNGSNVKMVEHGDRIIVANDTQLVSVGKAQGDKQTIDSSSVADFDADATHAYWSEAQNPGRIRRVKTSN